MSNRQPLVLAAYIVLLPGCSQETGARARDEAVCIAADSEATRVRRDTLAELTRQRTPTPEASGGDTVAVGIVRVWGADPFPQFALAPPPPGGPAVALEGALRDELGALVGIEVRVTGRAIAHQPPLPDRAILVSSYEIVSVAGRKPHVGVLRQDGADVSLGATRLVGAPDELRHAIGAKVWVLGTTRDGALAVESYGIVRRP